MLKKIALSAIGLTLISGAALADGADNFRALRHEAQATSTQQQQPSANMQQGAQDAAQQNTNS